MVEPFTVPLGLVAFVASSALVGLALNNLRNWVKHERGFKATSVPQACLALETVSNVLRSMMMVIGATSRTVASGRRWARAQAASGCAMEPASRVVTVPP